MDGTLTTHHSNSLHVRRQAFLEIMEILDKRMNDKGKNWRHVFKVRPPFQYILG
jgi:hypothetical protein